MSMEMQTIIVAAPPPVAEPPLSPPPQNPVVGPAAGAPVADLPLPPGTCCSLAIRAVQFISIVLALGAMASADDFHTVPAFIFLVAACALQSLWVSALALLDLYAMVAHFPLANHWAASLFTFGDVITAMLTLCAASASSGIILLIHADMNTCDATKNCVRFGAATGMAFISFLAFLPSILLNWLKLHVLGS